jgi:phosphoglycolate phosphatase
MRPTRGDGMSMNRRLVLFDIDGTLLESGLVSKRAFLQAIEDIFGCRISTDGYSFAGKTDPQIVKGLLEVGGLEVTGAEDQLPAVFRRYLTLLRADLAGPRARRMRLLPGAEQLLTRLRGEDEVMLGLLTGNIRAAARLKLDLFDLNRYFPIGAFGDDDPDRRRLPPIARARAKEEWGISFAPDQVVVVGDTAEDIRCARANSATSVAVATGAVSLEGLAQHGPDHLFSTLEDADAFVAAVTVGAGSG